MKESVVLLHPGPGRVRPRVPLCRQVGRILRGHSGRLGGAQGRGGGALSGLSGLGRSGAAGAGTGLSTLIRFRVFISLVGLSRSVNITTAFSLILFGSVRSRISHFSPVAGPGPAQSGSSGGFPDETVVNRQDDGSQRHGQDVDHHGCQSHPLLVGSGHQPRLLLPGVGGCFDPRRRPERGGPVPRVPHYAPAGSGPAGGGGGV